MSRMTPMATRVPLAQIGYSLGSSEDIEDGVSNTAPARDFDVVARRHVSRAAGGSVITTSELQSLLFPTRVLGEVRLGVSRLNYGLADYLNQLQSDELIRLDAELVPPIVQPISELPLTTGELTNHARIIGSAMANRVSALIVREQALTLEELAVSIVAAFPRTRILFLANSQRILRGVANSLRQAGSTVALTTSSSARHGFIPSGNVTVAVSTIARAADFHESFNLVVVLDQAVLDQSLTQNYFHLMLAQAERMLPRVLGIVTAGPSYWRHFSGLCASYGFAHFHLAGSDKVRRSLHTLRVQFDHPHALQDWDARRELQGSVLFNDKRNRRISRVVKTILNPSSSNHRVPREFRDWARTISRPRIAIVVDELLHAAELLKELSGWQLATRWESAQINETSLGTSTKDRLVGAKELQQGPGVIVVSDSLRQARNYNPDVIFYAGGTNKFPEYKNWLFSRDVDRPCLLIHLYDSGVSGLSFNARRRRQQLTALLVPELGQSDAAIRMEEFHRLQVLARSRRPRT